MSYYPSLNSYTEGITTDSFYQKYDSSVTSERSEEYIIISLSTAQKCTDIDYLSTDGFKFVTFDKISDSDYEYNMQIMQENFFSVENSEINNNSVDELDSQYAKFLSVLAIIIVAVIIGIISYSIVSVMKTKRASRLYYQCGATAGQCFGVTVIKGAVIFVSAVLISFIAFAFLVFTNVPENLGLRFLGDNITLTGILIIATFAIYIFTSMCSFITLRRTIK